MRAIWICILMVASMPLFAQLRGSAHYNADNDPALQESWRLLRYTQNATQSGDVSMLNTLRRGSMQERWQSAYDILPRDLQRLIGPCMAAVPEAIALTIEGWDLITHARENEHGRQRSASVGRANALIGRAQRLVSDAMSCWYDAKGEYVRRGGRRPEEGGQNPPNPPNPLPPSKGKPDEPDCRSADGLKKLDDEKYALVRVDGSNMEFGLATTSRPNEKELAAARIVSSGTYTLNHGFDSVGPLIIRSVDDIVQPDTHKAPHYEYKKGLQTKQNGKSVVRRGGVAIMKDGRVILGRQTHEAFEEDKLSLVRAYMGGGAVLIERGKPLKDDLDDVQGFDGGLGSPQFVDGAHRIMFGDCYGTIYWIATPRETGLESQTRLAKAKFQMLVSFDGGTGAYAFGHLHGFDGRVDQHKDVGNNVNRIFIGLKKPKPK